MTATREGYTAAQIPDMERRLAQLVRIGTVSEIDYSDKKKPRVRVQSGKIKTGWIPFNQPRAGRKRSWNPLKVGEQVVMVSPGGDLAQAVIIGSINYNDREAPANGEMEWVDAFDDGATMSYDEETHTLTHDIPTGGTIILKIGNTTLTMTQSSVVVKSSEIEFDTPKAKFTGDVDVDGKVTAVGDVIGERVSLAHHVNTGVTPGPANTGEPLAEA